MQSPLHKNTKSYTPVVIVFVIFIAIALVIHFYGGGLMESLRSLHGGGGGH